MPDINQQDIAYQPAAQGYSFSTNPTVPTQPGEKPKKKANIFVLLVIEIFGLLVIFAIFLLVLNYFRIISLSGILPRQLASLPQTAQAPVPTHDSKTNLWTAKGAFYGYNNHVIQIRINNRITDFQWADGDGNSSAALYGSEKNLSDLNYTATPFTLFDLEQNQNLGKKVIIQYKIENGKNIISSLSLFKL